MKKDISSVLLYLSVVISAIVALSITPMIQLITHIVLQYCASVKSEELFQAFIEMSLVIFAIVLVYAVERDCSTFI